MVPQVDMSKGLGTCPPDCSRVHFKAGCEAALQVSFMADVHRMMELHLSSSPASGPC
ncbi:hypothetical protein F7725_006431 [Dissostichus mawsoni]|uniref:Uncharacterized protein n=1 Tax=Dissostichus mawsoni TaxID=36200 RepID=A0A7J5XVQ0_DISMA|nr:hypothetical protein F7725_006431 [Dissostichus mawsoni]